jgi:Xaa-Pro dipeptidase
MIEVQQAIANEGKPGTRAGDLYALALDVVKKAGLSTGFMGYPQPVPFVGHGIGLELDEWPVIGRNSQHILEKGMTIALEPKIIFPGEGVAGVENTFVVGEDGMEKLSRFPDDIIII